MIQNFGYTKHPGVPSYGLLIVNQYWDYLIQNNVFGFFKFWSSTNVKEPDCRWGGLCIAVINIFFLSNTKHCYLDFDCVTPIKRYSFVRVIEGVFLYRAQRHRFYFNQLHWIKYTGPQDDKSRSLKDSITTKYLSG